MFKGHAIPMLLESTAEDRTGVIEILKTERTGQNENVMNCKSEAKCGTENRVLKNIPLANVRLSAQLVWIKLFNIEHLETGAKWRIEKKISRAETERYSVLPRRLHMR